jgi:hypothetical protein
LAAYEQASQELAVEELEGQRVSLAFSQIFDFVRSPPVAGRLGSGLPGAKAFAANITLLSIFLR